MVTDYASIEEDENFPEELSLGEMDELDSEVFDDLDKAIEYAREHGGQVYTQVDGEEDRMYTRGVHVVNRTGIHAVVRYRYLSSQVPICCPKCGGDDIGTVKSSDWDTARDEIKYYSCYSCGFEWKEYWGFQSWEPEE